MDGYLSKLEIMYGDWEDFRRVIEDANSNLEQDFNSILSAIPQDYIPDYLQWMIDAGNSNIVTRNIDGILQSMIDYKERRKAWIEKSIIILEDLNDSNVNETISDNLMNIIKGPYKQGNLWVIFNLCERCKNIGNSREVIEENYLEILETVFSNNEFLSNNKEIIHKIKELIDEIAKKEGVRLSDITHIGSGQYSECIKIGETVLKFGKKRILEDLPVHKRILTPTLRKNIPSDYKKQIEDGIITEENVIGIECQSLVEQNWTEGLTEEEIEEKLYEIYKELRSSGIIWVDIKPENVGKLLKPNIIEKTFKGPNGEDIKQRTSLPEGELVVFDTDRIYTKGNLPKFDERNLKKSLFRRKGSKMNLREKIEEYIPQNEQEESDKTLMLEFINKFDDVLTRENRMGHFTASSWIVNKERTKVLMIYHNIYDSWAWTGGHCDGDPDLLHVALKEAEEETGLKNIKVLTPDIASLEIVTVDGHVKRGKYVSSHVHLNCTFLLEADEAELLKIKPDENSGVKWFDIDEALNVTSENKMIDIYKKLNNKVKKL